MCGGGVELMIVGILWFWDRVGGMGFAGDFGQIPEQMNPCFVGRSPF